MRHWQPDHAQHGSKDSGGAGLPERGWLRFVRNYNAYGSGRPEHVGKDGDGQLGEVWRSNIDKRLYPGLISAHAAAAMTLPSGSLQYFTGAGEELLPGLSPNRGKLGSGSGYIHLSDSGVDQFDDAGKLVLTSTVSGRQTRIVYSDGSTGGGGAYIVDKDGNPTAQTLPAGVAIRAEDPFGRSISFAYDAYLRLVKMTVPGGLEFRYAYDTKHNLVSVGYPDGATKRYHYEDPRFPNALTGITDENGVRYVEYSYDAQGRAEGEVYSAVAGGVNRYRLVYGADQTTVADPLGTERVYGFQTIQGVMRSTGTTQPGGSGCGASSSSQSYDANGNVASRSDFNGNVTIYDYDPSRNLETRRTEASGKPEARTIHTEWHADWRLPVRIAEPRKRSFYVYNGDLDPETGSTTSCAPAEAVLPGLAGGVRPIGVLCKKTEQGTADESGGAGFAASVTGVARTWRWTYDRHGQVLSEDGPRTDVADITTYSYYDATDADITKRGRLSTITNALGHLTRITAYDSHGKPLTIVDPNGVETVLVYDERQRLLSRTAGDETSAYTWDVAGQLIRIEHADGSRLEYEWDGAHRLTGIADGLGNRIRYTLDAIGNRIREDIEDPQGLLTQTRRREYDALNRLSKDSGAQNQSTVYGYDANGNRTTVTDPLNHSTVAVYDGLDRLIRLTDPAGGVIQYVWNGQGRLISVTDPRNLETAYTIDGLGDTLTIRSPDTGTALRTYDAAGNERTRTDARNKTTTTHYDALNRSTQITDTDGRQIQFLWDQGANGKGRLTRIDERENGALVLQTHYAYDTQGRLQTETRSFFLDGKAVTHTQSYVWSGGRLMAQTLPSGRQLNYTHDAAGRIVKIELTHVAPKAGQTQTIAQAIAYHPWGGLKSWTDGAGQIHTRTQDLDGRINGYTLDSASWQIRYDAAGRIIEQRSASVVGSYAYDALDRLTGANYPMQTYGYGYDATGNRTSQSVGGTAKNYTIEATSNRLQSVSGTPARSLTHDAAGNVTHDGQIDYAYDARGRLNQADNAYGTTSYRVNALGLRIQKSGNGVETHYHYDVSNRLIAESGAGGVIEREYLWLGTTPIATID